MTSGEPANSVSAGQFGAMPGSDVAHFANPFLACDECFTPVEGFTWYSHTLIPCGHVAGLVDTCPTWSPVDGCTCSDVTLTHRTPQR